MNFGGFYTGMGAGPVFSGSGTKIFNWGFQAGFLALGSGYLDENPAKSERLTKNSLDETIK